MDLNKALQDVRKPMFGQEENAKQALHPEVKSRLLNHLLEGELSRDARSQTGMAPLRSKMCLSRIIKTTYTKNKVQHKQMKRTDNKENKAN